ncbi:Pre-mRNA-processing factor 17 [Ceratocystis lukuohia]|uniref:Pre-mRNA-processing factor 17 n=1 Tax=Ceratocystis lukuohia TaxID=2019550 RepID=A0ABR4MQD8_9PEZI
MADLNKFPANMAPRDALIVREQAPLSHTADIYSREEVSRPSVGPANPFSQDGAKKRKNNVLTGFAEETIVSEHTFRAKHQAVERRGGPERAIKSATEIKKEASNLRATREKKGDATIVEGAGAYVGPWAKYKPRYQDVDDDESLASDEEYEEIEVTDDEDIVASGTTVSAPSVALERRKEVESLGTETTIFHGSQEFDYQGRTFMHIPQDLNVDLRKEPGSITNFIPKKQIHAWKESKQAITSLRLFPKSSHLLLSASADSTIRIYDVYHSRELLRTYNGHSKALSDTHFNHDGTKFISSSWDRTIKLWDTETGKCLGKFSNGKTAHVIRWNNLSPDHHNEFIAGMSNNTILQYDTRVGNEIIQDYNHHLSDITTLEFLDEGRRFMSSSNDKTVRAWDYGIPVPTKIIAEIDMFAYTRSCLHPSGKHVLYQSGDNSILAYSTGDKIRQNRKKLWKGHHTVGTAIDVTVSPDGQFVTSGDSAGFLVFWDFKKGTMLHKIQASKTALTCMAWSEQETSKVFTAGQDGQVRLWD